MDVFTFTTIFWEQVSGKKVTGIPPPRFQLFPRPAHVSHKNEHLFKKVRYLRVACALCVSTQSELSNLMVWTKIQLIYMIWKKSTKSPKIGWSRCARFLILCSNSNRLMPYVQIFIQGGGCVILELSPACLQIMFTLALIVSESQTLWARM